jgi:glycosyltransferase involved in cell wall biosynthesis
MGGNYEIRILCPEYWESRWFKTKKPQVFRPSHEKEEHYEVWPVPTTDHRDWSRYLIKNLHAHIIQFAPDVIYCIHEEGIRALHQSIIYRRIFAPGAKLLYFTMDVFPRVPTGGSRKRRLSSRVLWGNVRWGTDGAVCHYPGIRRQLRRESYQEPILMQSQIGVNAELFRPNPEARRAIRNDLNLAGFVVGFVGRLTEAKGVHDLLAALEQLPVQWSLLLVGDGELRENIRAWAAERGYEDRVRLIGRCPKTEVPAYMNAMDCLVLGSHRTEHWIDTFPNVVPEAMCTKTPVIGSESGAIPFQLGGQGMLFPEGDADELRRCLLMLARSPERGCEMGKNLRRRAVRRFSVDALNRDFHQFLETYFSC